MLYGNILVVCIQKDECFTGSSVTILFTLISMCTSIHSRWIWISFLHTHTSGPTLNREKLCVGVRLFPGIHGYSKKHAATMRRAVKSSKRVRPCECYQSYCGLCDLGLLRRLAMETGSNFCAFSISFSDARRLQGIEGGGEKEAYGAQPTPYKQANKHIHIATHVQMHSDAKSVTSPRAGAHLSECAECVCVCVRENERIRQQMCVGMFSRYLHLCFSPCAGLDLVQPTVMPPSHCTPPLAHSPDLFFLCQHNAGTKLESVSLSLIGSAEETIKLHRRPD